MYRKKNIQPKNLHNLDVLINDTSPSSHFFRIKKDDGSKIFEGEQLQILLGKQIFYIEGSRLLKPKSEIQVELIQHGNQPTFIESEEQWVSDSPDDDNVIYTEIMHDYLTAAGERAVSIQLFDQDVIPNPDWKYCTLTIVGELDPTKTFLDPQSGKTIRVPIEWQNVYNVKWQCKVVINWNAEEPPVNDKKIIFKGTPGVLVEELIVPSQERIYMSASDASKTQSLGAANFYTADLIDPSTGNVISNPNSYGSHISLSSGSGTTQPIFSSSIFPETIEPTQSLTIPLVDGDTETNILPSFLHGFESYNLHPNHYSESLLGTLGEGPFGSPFWDAGGNNSPWLFISGNIDRTLVKPGSFIRVNNEVIQLGHKLRNGTYEHTDPYYEQAYLAADNDPNLPSSWRPAEYSDTQTVFFLHDYGDSNGGRGKFQQLGFSAPVDTHSAGDNVYLMHMTPFTVARNSDVSVITSDGAVEEKEGVYFYKSKAWGTDAYTQCYTNGDGFFVPVLDAFPSTPKDKYTIRGGETVTFKTWARGDGLGYHTTAGVQPGKRKVTMWMFFLGASGDYRPEYGGFGNAYKIHYIGSDWEMIDVEAIVPEGTKYITIRYDNDGMDALNTELYSTTGTNLIADGVVDDFAKWKETGSIFGGNTDTSGITISSDTGYPNTGTAIKLQPSYSNAILFEVQGTGYNIEPWSSNPRYLYSFMGTYTNGYPSPSGWEQNGAVGPWLDEPGYPNGHEENASSVAMSLRGHRVSIIGEEAMGSNDPNASYASRWNGQYKHDLNYDTYGTASAGDVAAELLEDNNLKNQSSTSYLEFHGYNSANSGNTSANEATASNPSSGWYKVNRNFPDGTASSEFLQSDTTYRVPVYGGAWYKMQFDVKHDGTLDIGWISFFLSGGTDNGHHTVTPTVVDHGSYKTVYAVYKMPGHVNNTSGMKCRVVDFGGTSGTFTWLAIKNVSMYQVCNISKDRINHNDLLAVASQDAVKYTSAWRAALQSYGATDPHVPADAGPNPADRAPYAFLGQKRLSIGEGFEDVNNNATNGPNAKVAAYWVDGILKERVASDKIYMWETVGDGNHFVVKDHHKYRLTFRAKASKDGVNLNKIHLRHVNNDNLTKLIGYQGVLVNASWGYYTIDYEYKYDYPSSNGGWTAEQSASIGLGIDARTKHQPSGFIWTKDDWIMIDDVKFEEYEPSTIYFDKPSVTVNYKTKLLGLVNDRRASLNPTTHSLFKYEYDQRDLSDLPYDTGQMLPYTMSWYQPGGFLELANHYSYAKLDIVNMETWAGDVNRIKVSYREHGSGDNWPESIDEILENQELYLDYSSSVLGTRIGLYEEQMYVTQSLITPEGGSMLHDTTYRQNSVKFSNDGADWSGSTNDGWFKNGSRFITTNRGIMDLQGGEPYKLTLRVQATINSAHKNNNMLYHNTEDGGADTSISKARPRLLIYMSGSKWKNTTNLSEDTYENSYDSANLEYDNAEGGGYGRLIGEYSLPADFTGQKEWNGYAGGDEQGQNSWDIIVPTTYADANNDLINDYKDSILLYRVIGHGDWIVNNVSVMQEKSSNLSPPNYRFYALMPRNLQDKKIDFKVDFYNPVNNQEPAKTIISKKHDFAGGNYVILGESNFLSGSMWMGSEIGSGIEMAGVSSAYIRSVGYKTYMSASRGTGKAGFMIWSGSVMGSISDEYSGSNVDSVGFEFHGGSGSVGETTPGARDGKTNALRFRTDTGKLEVTGTIAADDGIIGDWVLDDGRLSGSNITLDANSSALFKTDDSENYFIDFTPGSGSGTPDSNREDHYIKFGPNFGVKNDGTLVASGAKIEGVLTSSEGFIGGWKIETDKLKAHNQATDTPGNMMLSGSGVISSSNFYVSADGDMSASNAWFTGTVTASVVESQEGNISGWTLGPGVLSDANNIIKLQPSGGLYVISSSDFQVSNQGQMTASAGKIAGFDINGTKLQQGTSFYLDGDTGGSNFISSSNFQVTPSGQLYGQHATFDGTISVTGTGTIASFTLNSDEIKSSNNKLRLKSDGQITASNALISGSDVDINVSNFELDTDGVDISTTNKTVKVGSSNLSLTTGSGAFLSGSGEFKIGDDDGFIRFQNDSLVISGADANINVTDLNISSSGFTVSSNQKSMSLGDNQEILLDADSGTGGIPVIKVSGGEISASNFFVDAQGQMTASAGLVGGWEITEAALKKGGIWLGQVSSGRGLVLDSGSGVGNFQNYFYNHDALGAFFRVGDDSNSPSSSYIQYNNSGLNLHTKNVEISASGLELSSTEKSMSLGNSREIILDADAGTGNVPIIKVSGGEISASKFFVSTDGSMTSSAALISGSDVDINVSTFELAATDLDISSTGKSISLGEGKILLDGDGGTGGAPIIKLDGGEISSSGFFVSTIGEMTASSGKIAGFDISGSYLKHGSYFYLDGAADGTMGGQDHRYFISSSKFNVNHLGNMTGSQVFFSGGTIAGWKIDSNRFYKDNSVYINSNTEQIYLGHANYSDAEIAFSGSGEGKLASGAINWDSSGNLNVTGSKVTLSLTNFDLDTPTMDIQSNTSNNNPKILIYSASGGNEIVRIGQIHSNYADPEYGMKIYDGTGTTDSDELVRLGTAGNRIGGWEITQGQFRTLPASGFGGSYAENEQGLILHASGTLETADFVSGLKGWRISSEGNGTAEFENAKIRGTLSTTVFEKESVNVVGGQLMVANSTQIGPLRSGSEVLAGDVTMSAAQTTMSVHNVSGFVVGEVLKMKKVEPTGFSVEYLKVEGLQRYSTDPAISASISSSLAGTSIDPDGLYGQLHVQRAYGSSTDVSESISKLDNAVSSTTATSLQVLSNAQVTFSLQDVVKINDERMKVIDIPDTTHITVTRDFHDTVASTHSNQDVIYKVNTDLEFLSDLVSTAKEYNEGQVVVSTGVYNPSKDVSSGYMLLNAKPDDISTPYMDIIERTGSGPYDVQLRTRIGDLSGLSSGYLYGNDEPGFGIYTNNGFFRGTLTAETGSFKGIVHIATDNNDMKFGVSSSKDATHGLGGDKHGIHINDYNYWYNDGIFRFGKVSQYIRGTDGGGGNIDVEVSSSGFHLNTDGTVTASAGKIANWNISSDSINKDQVYLDSSEKSLLIKNSTLGKNIIRVGNAAMSSVAGASDRALDGGFELDDVEQVTSMSFWNSRKDVSSAITILDQSATETDGYIQMWVTASDPGAGSRNYRIKLDTTW